ncbi:MAG: type II toxin-antitoxin system MqsA family antitoxin [Methylomonas sp.]|nr:type II toxin-antitoxin system MqsA family antitoxin [Methylomonas sp.]
MKTSQCPICATGELGFFSAMDEIQYKGQALSVKVEYAVCQHCGDEMILPEQIKRNDCRTRDAWRKADGLLTGEEIVSLRTQLGITQQEAAEMFGGGANAFSKYERGEVIQSQAMDNLMRLAMEKQPVDVSEWLRNRAGLINPEQSYSKVVPITAKSKRLNVVPSSAPDLSENFKEASYG